MNKEILMEMISERIDSDLPSSTIARLIDIYRGDFRPPKNLEEVVFVAVEDVLGPKKEQVMSRSRLREYVTPRQIIYKILHDANEREYNYSVIGRMFKKDHATVRHAIIECNNLMETDDYFRMKFESVKERVDNEMMRIELQRLKDRENGLQRKINKGG